MDGFLELVKIDLEHNVKVENMNDIKYSFIYWRNKVIQHHNKKSKCTNNL